MATIKEYIASALSMIQEGEDLNWEGWSDVADDLEKAAQIAREESDRLARTEDDDD